MKMVNMDSLIVANIIVLIVLSFLAYEDYRYRSISIIRLVVIMVVAGVYRGFHVDADIYDIIAGVAIIAGLALYCRFTGNIGAADIVVMIFLAMMKGVTFTVISVVAAMAVLCLTILVRVLVRRVSLDREIPFIPYLGLGVMGVMLCV